MPMIGFDYCPGTTSALHRMIAKAGYLAPEFSRPHKSGIGW
jgi:hypothetical protein